MALGEDGQDFSQVMSYVPSSQNLQHTLTFAIDGIITGRVYSFKLRAKNSKGYSEFSNIVAIAAVDPPDKPNAPSVNYGLSGDNSLFIHWSKVADQQGPGGLITGYSLYMDDGYGGVFSEIFNSVGTSPMITEYLVSGIKLSLIYRFRVVSYNFNPAASLPSDITFV